MLAATYSKRIERFQAALAGQADLAFFPISADLQYLAGVQREMPTFGAVRHPGSWVEGIWITPHAAPLMALTRMTADFNNPGGMNDVLVLGDHDSPEALLKEIIRKLGIEELTTIAFGERTSGETMIQVQQAFPAADFCSASELLIPQRMIKDEAEIAVMREAGRITEAAFTDVLKHLKHGMAEVEVMLEVDYQLKMHGAFGPSFNTTLYAVGPEHELFFNQPEETWRRPLDPPVSILFDFGAIHQGYCYDFGRTVYFGTPDAEMVEVHRLVMASQEAGIAALRAGQARAEEVDDAARNVITAAGMGAAFRHRLGHAIGLDVHEAPFLTKGDRRIVQEGMLFTVEPSIIVPFGSSARVEDVVLVGKDGGIPLTTSFQDLIVIE